MKIFVMGVHIAIECLIYIKSLEIYFVSRLPYIIFDSNNKKVFLSSFFLFHRLYIGPGRAWTCMGGM